MSACALHLTVPYRTRESVSSQAQLHASRTCARSRTRGFPCWATSFVEADPLPWPQLRSSAAVARLLDPKLPEDDIEAPLHSSSL